MDDIIIAFIDCLYTGYGCAKGSMDRDKAKNYAEELYLTTSNMIHLEDEQMCVSIFLLGYDKYMEEKYGR